MDHLILSFELGKYFVRETLFSPEIGLMFWICCLFLFFFLKKGGGHLEISPLLDEFLHFPESKKTIVSCNWTV